MSTQDTRRSLRLHLEDFFGYADDDEWLTPEDVAFKWGTDLEAARRALNGMVAEGLLERFAVPSGRIKREVSAYRRLRVVVLVEARGLA